MYFPLKNSLAILHLKRKNEPGYMLQERGMSKGEGNFWHRSSSSCFHPKTPSPLGGCVVLKRKAVIPAQAGIQFLILVKYLKSWRPAFAGMIITTQSHREEERERDEMIEDKK